MFLLSADGYRYLGEQLPSAGAGEFAVGMKRRPGQPAQPAISSDPPVRQWERPYQGPIHAMALLADDDPTRLGKSEEEVTDSISGISEVITIERGRAMEKVFPDETVGKVIEHFGFQDGTSQPIMIQQDLDDEISKRGNSQWDPGAPLSLALAEEPGSEPGSTERLGSFMVFRKLEQDVKAFREAIARLSSESGISPEDAGAIAVGRFENGEPVLPGVGVTHPEADKNDLRFGSHDAQGSKCPFHAHIRKTDPRGDLKHFLGQMDEFERAMRIVGRGITYDERRDREAGAELDVPSEGVGLLFMCLQANLRQFVIQQDGSDSNDFVKTGVGSMR
jgi:deferrochelatase/peroxidase EfeB